MFSIKDVVVERAKIGDFDGVDSVLSDITEAIKKSSHVRAGYLIESGKFARKEIFKDILSSDSGIVFIARYKGEIVGVVNLQFVKNIRHGWRRIHLEEVVVKKAFQRKGIGMKMIRTICKFCKRNNIKVIKLMCGDTLSDAKKFYEHCGFANKDSGYRLELD